MATFPFSRVLDYERLPIDSQDVVTRARVVVAGDRSQDTELVYTEVNAPGGRTHVPYWPVPVAREHAAAEHATYGAERSFALPAGVDPFLRAPQISGHSLTSLRFTNAGNVIDDNPSTHAAFSGTPTQAGYLRYGYGAMPDPVGFRISYELELDDDVTESPVVARVLVAQHLGFPFAPGGLFGWITKRLPPAKPASSIMVVAPKGANDYREAFSSTHGQPRVSLEVGEGVAALRVYEFLPLVVDDALVQSIARAQIRLPASNPRRVVVQGYLPPGDKTHTIVGWPGGTYTGAVARQSYADGNTVVDFEQAGAPPGLSQEAVEAERVRLNRTREIVRTANYANLIRR